MEDINLSTSSEASGDYASLIQRLLRLKRRLHVIQPEFLARRQQRMDGIFPDRGNNTSQDFDLFLSALICIYRRDTSPTMGELSADMGVPLSTATRIIDGLVRNGYVQRESDSQDRRIVRVGMSAAGRALYQKNQVHLRRRIGQFLADFTPEERNQLIYLVNKLLNAIDTLDQDRLLDEFNSFDQEH